MTEHSFAPMAHPRAYHLMDSKAVDYDRRLIGFQLCFVEDHAETGFAPNSVMGLRTVFYLSFNGTTVPIAVASTARREDARNWEIMLGRASGVTPGPMLPGLFRVGHLGVDVPAGLAFALWMAVPFSAPIPQAETNLLWTYASAVDKNKSA